MKEKEEEIQEKWDFRKIAIGGIALVALLGVGLSFVLGFVQKNKKEGGTLGVSKEMRVKEVELPTEEDVNKIITEAKKNLSEITIENITASDAAIQKIVSDLQSLQSGKKQPVDIVCDLVCGSR